MTNPVVGTVVPLTINVHSDTLEVVMSTMKRAGVVLDELTAERDELLDALTALVVSLDAADGLQSTAGRSAMQSARSLIAQHEGKEAR
jgi:hypothetical protein